MRSITKALTSSGDYSDRVFSDSPDPDVSSTDNTPEATSQDEGTEEASSQENTAISEATRSMIHMEILTSQLNFWDRARRKRTAKRHNQGTSPKRGGYKPRRKSRRYSPTPKPSKRTPKKVLSEEPATDSQEKLPTTDEQLCSTDETFKATTLQQEHLSVTPPLTSDPLPPIEHTTPLPPDSWTLRAILPTAPSNLLTFFTSQLSDIPSITEVTNEETADGLGAHTTIRMKGSDQALYEAQRNLAASGQHNITWELDTPAFDGTTNANRWQLTMWEANKTYPYYSQTLEPGKEDKEVKERAKLTIEHSGSSTTQTQPFMTGAVKAIDKTTHYGFITADDGKDWFVLPKSCPGFNWQIPQIGTRVTFLSTTDNRTNRIRADSFRSEWKEYGGVWTHPPSDLTRRPIGS